MAGNGINKWDSQIIHELGTVSMFRGVDSTGVYSANTNRIKKSERLAKINEDYSYWRWWNDWKLGKKERVDFEDLSNNVFIGHTRAATLGLITNENAHPFDFDNIVGAHNGTLTVPKYMDTVKSDSFLMFEDISKRGMKTVLSELSDKCAYAISMLDKSSGKLWFALNGKRTLSFAVNTKRGVMYWASEASALEYVLKLRNHEDVTMFSLAPGMWGCSISDIRPTNHRIFSGYNIEQIMPKVATPPTPPATMPKAGVPWVEDNKVHTLSDYRADAGKKSATFTTTMKCCGEHIPLIEQYRMRAEKSEIGYFDNSDESYNHFYCSHPKKD